MANLGGPNRLLNSAEVGELCAVGRSILVIMWHLLADPAARFTDLGPGWHDEQAGRDRRIRSHLRQLQALGVDVTVNPTAA